MANYTNTTNMLLPVPTIGTDPGPDYATNLNNCMIILDAHDHSSGKGVQVTPAGLNINADLPMGSNNLTAARSLRMTAQLTNLSLSTDLGCLYVSGVDLYYNDVSGNQIRITQSGGVVGTPGSITNLASPASATWVSGSSTFVFQSAASTSANIDGASILLRNLTANSKALTLAPPNSMAADYSIVLPALPASQKIVTLDASGNLSAAYSVDGTTIAISSNIIGVVSGGIAATQLASNAVTTAKILDGAVTQAKRATATYALSASSGSAIHFTSGSFSSNINNLSNTITSAGRPLFIGLVDGGSGTNNLNADVNGTILTIQFLEDGVQIGLFVITLNNGEVLPGSICNMWRTPSSGSHTYTVRAAASGGASAYITGVSLVTAEI